MTTQQQIDQVYQVYQQYVMLYDNNLISVEHLDYQFNIYWETLKQLGPVDEEDEEPYRNERCFREKIGNVYSYRHQECGNPGYLGYTNAERAECHPAEQCVWCGGLMSEAPAER